MPLSSRAVTSNRAKSVTTTEHFEWDEGAEDWKPVTKSVETQEYDREPSVLPPPVHQPWEYRAVWHPPLQ